jgi:hypothetical protein
MKRLLVFSLSVLLVVAAAAQKTSPPAGLFNDIEKMSADLEEITGLKFSKKVPAAMINKEQLRKFLDERIDHAMKPADLRAEELTLKMLGLLPEDFDLRSETVDLLTEQAAAFYDYHKKKLFIIEGDSVGDSGGGGRIALVHELAHALADQNFHLEKYIKENGLSDDSATARMAVMEGQATWLMTAYMQKSMGGKPEVPEAMLAMMSQMVEGGATQYEVFSKAPLYIRESLIFPYTGGMTFQDAVFRKLGHQAFSEVFEHAPVSTQQVIHPEKYLARQEPRVPGVARIPDEKQFRKLADGTLGEFDYRAILEPAAGRDPARALAAHLAGSRYVLMEHKSERYPVLSFASTWDSPEQAKTFFELYRQVIQKKSKLFEPDAGEATLLTGRDDAGFFRVALVEDRVESIEGLKVKPINANAAARKTSSLSSLKIYNNNSCRPSMKND